MTGRTGGVLLRRFEYSQLHMGVRFRLIVYASRKETAERACIASYRRVAEIEDIMSDYRPTSELMRLCDRAGEGPIAVSRDLYAVLDAAQALSRESDGAFDVTVGPLVRLWREARKTGRLPGETRLREARSLTGWRKIRLHPARRAIELLAPGMRLDLGGIAKGYAADSILATLRKHGIPRALVEAGGDIRISGPPPGRKGWRIVPETVRSGQWIDPVIGSAGGKTVPDSTRPHRVPSELLLRNASLSTSGDTEQFVEIEGKRYSHIVDPRTGLGLTNRVSVMVLASDGVTSDGLATAICVMGPKKGKALLRARPRVKAWVKEARP